MTSFFVSSIVSVSVLFFLTFCEKTAKVCLFIIFPLAPIRADEVGSDFSELLGFLKVPFAVELVLPEGAGGVVSMVGVFTVDAFKFVRTRFTFLGLKSGGV